MEHSIKAVSAGDEALARVLAQAVEKSGKPRHAIAAACNMHRETLLRILRAHRPIGVDEASKIIAACGMQPRSALLLTMASHEDLACEWMDSEMGEFLEEFLASLPLHLDRTLGHRIGEVRPRWANGTAQLVARLLAKHIDDFVSRDISMTLQR